MTGSGVDRLEALLAAVLAALAAALSPETPEEAAWRHARHQRAHDRGVCTCDYPPEDSAIDGPRDP